jgi:hypothetical protein
VVFFDHSPRATQLTCQQEAQPTHRPIKATPAQWNRTVFCQGESAIDAHRPRQSCSHAESCSLQPPVPTPKQVGLAESLPPARPRHAGSRHRPYTQPRDTASFHPKPYRVEPLWHRAVPVANQCRRNIHLTLPVAADPYLLKPCCSLRLVPASSCVVSLEPLPN